LGELLVILRNPQHSFLDPLVSYLLGKRARFRGAPLVMVRIVDERVVQAPALPLWLTLGAP
jgi:hypothetical protein